MLPRTSRIATASLFAEMPPNMNSAMVAPSSRNQVLTSWLLATSPFLIASSMRFAVGSSDFSVSCPSASAMALAHHADEDGFEVIQERDHQRADESEQH